MHKVSVLAIGDHRMVREVWQRLFAGSMTIEIVGEGNNLEQGLALVEQLCPDLLLLDANLHNSPGIDAIGCVQKASPATKIIGVSIHSHPSMAKKMLCSGAKGYITKNSAQQEIVDAINTVMSGKIYVCSEIKDILSDQVFHIESHKPGIGDLSARQFEIVNYLKDGLTCAEIAERLGVTARTVEVHRTKILKKLKLKSPAALIHFVHTALSSS